MRGRIVLALGLALLLPTATASAAESQAATEKRVSAQLIRAEKQLATAVKRADKRCAAATRARRTGASTRTRSTTKRACTTARKQVTAKRRAVTKLKRQAKALQAPARRAVPAPAAAAPSVTFPTQATPTVTATATATVGGEVTATPTATATATPVATATPTATATATPTATPAIPGADPLPGGSVISSSLDYVKKIPNTVRTTEGKFDTVNGRDILVVNGSYGVKTIDVTDPLNPVELDTLLPSDLASFYQGEDMDLDTKRKLLFLSLDPRHADKDPAATGCTTNQTRDVRCKSGIYVVSYANPGELQQIGDFIDVPAGHTTSCIDDCRFLWTGGPARRNDLQYLGPYTPGGRGDGRPIWVTDMRDPYNPHVYGNAIDLYRNDGITDYSHDVQVDAEGIAWSSGRGGVRGFATSGRHRDPSTNNVREATPWDPVLVAGGGVDGVSTPEQMVMHNSARPLDNGTLARGVKPGNILVATEEQFNSDCASDGRIVLSDLTDSWGGEPAQNSSLTNPYRMKELSSWHPSDTGEAVGPSASCSAHYFDIKESVLAAGFYAQGTRILDILNARSPRQIGYFRVQADGTANNPSSNSFDVQFHGDYVWVFDTARGVEVLKLKEPTGVEYETVKAPGAKADVYADKVSAATVGLVCPIFEPSAAAVAAGF